ncbi:MAG: chemotaxis protein CheA, partial [Bdellovibrionales bacterium]|nr:chemotaxis protein CheA [Bdellovibrionales bacterium]
SVERLDKLNNLVGELVILESMIRNSGTQSAEADFIRSITQLGKLSKDIQDVTMSLRMLPIKPTLKKMHRVVRDVSLALDKKVNLSFIGEETEVDKTVIENLTDPLTHIVRNAVDHGIEDAEARRAAGKSEVAEVVIRCLHEGNNLVIEVIDDGKGIDAEVIRRKAIEKGVIKANQELSSDKIIQLIFHPGFSTKAEVSEISGRGVGMDVVKTNIEGMSGRVQVKTKLGGGSTFRIELPLTMAVIDGMILNHAGQRYVVPLNQVHETLQPTKDSMHSITGLGEVIVVRGEKISICKLSQVLGFKGNEKPPEEQTAVIIRSPKGALAVFVDDITGRQQVVIKKIDNHLNRKNLFIGSSILGDGLPSLIVDLHQILEMSVSHKEAISA